jgi:hypothetical protein
MEYPSANRRRLAKINRCRVKSLNAQIRRVRRNERLNRRNGKRMLDKSPPFLFFYSSSDPFYRAVDAPRASPPQKTERAKAKHEQPSDGEQSRFSCLFSNFLDKKPGPVVSDSPNLRSVSISSFDQGVNDTTIFLKKKSKIS